LAIESLAATQTCGDSTHAPTPSAYTSGMIQWTNFHFTYGTVAFKAKMAGGQGTWPAIWLLGANCQASNVLTSDNVGSCDWPTPGSDEIDITEIVNSDHVHVNQALHSGATNTNCTASTTDVTQNFHVYRLVWTARSLVWSIDGAETCTFSTGVPSTPMFVIINTALGGVGGPVSSSTLPQTMNVDYITVTQP
jgi:beta-glucanase (GH16 family)